MIETLFARASSSARLLEPPLGSLHLRVLENAGVVTQAILSECGPEKSDVIGPSRLYSQSSTSNDSKFGHVVAHRFSQRSSCVVWIAPGAGCSGV
jgi:hypothetical protein